MKLLFINNDGDGFANRIDGTEGKTVAELFAQRMSGRTTADFLIRVNRVPAGSEQILQSQNRISFTPTKIESAATAPQGRVRRPPASHRSDRRLRQTKGLL